MRGMLKVIAIVGPTAVGKTAFSIDLAKALGGEVISADSRQIYRGLDIGTGKATKEEMRGVPHHLLDIADPREVFSAADFVKEGRPMIEAISGRGRVPIIVGGTGFYIDALLGTAQLADVPRDSLLREELKERTLEELQKELRSLDPEKEKTIDTKNRPRLVRAIEIARRSGSVPASAPEKLYEVLWIGIALPKQELERSIHVRLESRIQSGMLEEAKKLYADGLSYERMEGLGLEYRYMARYLQEQISYDEMFAQLETEIRRYAKRQMTWFKRNTSIHWLSPREIPKALGLAKEFLCRL